jgi:hypothetical protein
VLMVFLFIILIRDPFLLLRASLRLLSFALLFLFFLCFDRECSTASFPR